MLSSIRGPEGVRTVASSRRIYELLRDDPLYRARWERHAVHHRGPAVHQGAVAAVIAEHLWHTGQAPESDRQLPRRLKDLVSRALSGRVLSARTLRLFVDAFGMSSTHATQLEELRSGRSPVPGMPDDGPDGGPVDGRAPKHRAPSHRAPRLRSPDRSAPGRGPASGVPADGPISDGASAGGADRAAPGFRTLALQEVHEVGPDGVPSLHRTVHVIRAVREVSHYLLRVRADRVQVQVVRGGRAGPVHRRGQHAAAWIELARPLRPGQTTRLEYVTRLGYEDAPPQVFRRAAATPLENLEVHLRFHPLRLPAQVWWAVWTLPAGTRPLRQEAVQLDRDGCAHRFLPTVQDLTVGFRWRFAD